ncbi:endonuclease/exonuclease/phosphatase family protein [Flagellimonas sp.]|uniref:endonuclease/exonuclease/phosphatase family protein n=1 Tax=Flagellimonas sp. TaxID=2058762 RepID=UPI003BAB53D9
MNTRYLNIGSWNIEHFGKIDDNDENQYALAEHIELSGVDILALQELYLTESHGYENIHLREALDLVEEHTGCHWEYEIFPNRNENDKSQLCGIIWNKAKVEKIETFRIPVSYNADFEGQKLWLWDRSPHAIKFSAGKNKTDIVIVPLHMKSNVGSPHVVVRTRYEEAKTLIVNLPMVREKLEDEDIILIGDTNCKGSYEDAIKEFVKGGFDDLNSDDVSTFVRGDNAPFDRIFIARGEKRKSFLYSRQYILRATNALAHDMYLSDHFVIKTSVKIRHDND